MKASMNTLFRKNSHTTATTMSSSNSPSEKSQSPTTTTTSRRSIFSRKSKTSGDSDLTSLPVPTTRRAEAAQPSARTSATNRPRISKDHYRPRHPHSTCRHRPRHSRKRSATKYPYTSSFPCPLHSPIYPQPPKPTTFTARTKHTLTQLRKKCHAIKFNLLFELTRLQIWFNKHLHPQACKAWVKHHILRQKPEPRRPFFPRGPTCYEQMLIDRKAEAEKEKRGRSASVGEIKGRIRKLSQSTVRSLKKACSLDTEQDELREEDRRAMERLDELWRRREEWVV